MRGFLIAVNLLLLALMVGCDPSAAQGEGGISRQPEKLGQWTDPSKKGGWLRILNLTGTTQLVKVNGVPPSGPLDPGAASAFTKVARGEKTVEAGDAPGASSSQFELADGENVVYILTQGAKGVTGQKTVGHVRKPEGPTAVFTLTNLTEGPLRFRANGKETELSAGATSVTFPVPASGEWGISESGKLKASFSGEASSDSGYSVFAYIQQGKLLTVTLKNYEPMRPDAGAGAASAGG